MIESSNNFKIVVLIATIGRTGLLDQTLSSIDACKKPDNFKYVYVIENGGSSSAKNIVERYDELTYKYMRLEKPGKSAALNHVIENHIHDDDLLLFTDDDIIVNPSWIENFNKAARKFGRKHFYGGSFSVKYEKEPDDSIKPLLPLSARGLTDEQYKKREIFHGCNWGAFKSDLERSGLFDEAFGPGSVTGATGQETIMQRRMLAGDSKAVFIENNAVQHMVPESHSNIQWLGQRAVRSGFESANKKEIDAPGSIYYLFRLSTKIAYNYLRRNKLQLNRHLLSTLRVSGKILQVVNVRRNTHHTDSEGD